MATQLLNMGQLDQANKIFAQVLSAEPDNIKAIIGMGSVFRRQGDTDSAIKKYIEALNLGPQSADIYIQLARLFQQFGQFEHAADSFRGAIRLEPDNATSYLDLALISTYSSADDTELEHIEGFYRQAPADSEQKQKLAFALGKIWDDLADFGKAFRYFAEGNRIARHHLKYSAELERKKFQNIKRIFGPDFIKQHALSGIEDGSPIFIVGMPRSGSTLVEQILASHPNVFGAGEASCFPTTMSVLRRDADIVFPGGFDTISSAQLGDLAREYIRQLRALAGQESRITDKMLSNYFFIGIIAVTFPNAKIIHCSRDSRDQCLSIFQKDLGPDFGWSYDLHELGQYSAMYKGLMEHWNSLFPGRIFDSHYESLIANSEDGIRQILDFCGLPFDAACLDFHKTERSVLTLSRAQVRKPIYTQSVSRWRNYENDLAPLLAALSAGDDNA
jgi:tetratricopeptide (TPR) repeat protein